MSNADVLSKLAAIEAALLVMKAELASVPSLNATNMAALKDDIGKMFEEKLVQHVAAKGAKKEKKEAPPADATTADAASGADAAASEEKTKKAVHPKYSKIAKTAWEPKTKATTEHDKIKSFLLGMWRLYEGDLAAVIEKASPGLIAEVRDLAEFKAAAAAKKAGSADLADAFITQLWAHAAKTAGRVDAVSKAVCEFYQKERATMDNQKIDQVAPEGPTAAEAAGQAAATASS